MKKLLLKTPLHTPTNHSTDIVLISGFMCDASLWRSMETGLQTLGHLHYADLTEGDSIESMAATIAADLPDRCVLIGFSLGGYVARHLATLAPEKIRKLVLLNTSARATTAEEIQRNQQQIKMLQTFPYKGQTATALKRALHPARSDNPPLLDYLQSVSLKLGRDVFLRQLGIVRGDGDAELRQISCPTLVIASREDQMRSLEETQNMVAALRQAQLAVIEDCGHMSPLEQPQKLLELLSAFVQS